MVGGLLTHIMPELPEVETVRRGLADMTCAQTVLGGEVLLARTIASPDSPEAFLQALEGCQIKTWQRRGKYLLAQLQDAHGIDRGHWGVHLRMTGQLLWVKQQDPLSPHTRVRLFFPQHRELRFVDMRTFGQMWWVPPDRSPETVIQTLATLGPEPLGPDFSAAYLQQRLARVQRPIKNALLDQGIVAGIGNIYADESLFLSQIHPCTPSATLTLDQLKRLQTAILGVLETSLGHGGTTMRDFRNLKGLNGNYGDQAWVYRRTGEPCHRCGTTIDRLKLGGRSTHVCPTCQPPHSDPIATTQVGGTA